MKEEELREAACVADLEHLKKLIDEGVDVNSKNKINQWTALHWAKSRGNVMVAELLVAAGASLHAVNSEGKTPAEVAKKERSQRQKTAANSGGVTNEKAPVSNSDAVDTNTDNGNSSFVPNYLKNPCSRVHQHTAPKNECLPVNNDKSAAVDETSAKLAGNKCANIHVPLPHQSHARLCISITTDSNVNHVASQDRSDLNTARSLVTKSEQELPLTLFVRVVPFDSTQTEATSAELDILCGDYLRVTLRKWNYHALINTIHNCFRLKKKELVYVRTSDRVVLRNHDDIRLLSSGDRLDAIIRIKS